jgi:imidazolonepropionase-like amidohydrolase
MKPCPALRVVLAALVLAAGFAHRPAAAQERDLVLRGGWLFDAVAEEVVRNPGVLLRAGRIMQVGGFAMPAAVGGVDVIDLADDRYILPGFIDLHAHHAVELFGRGRIDETFAYPQIFLANGVTTVFPAGEMQPEAMRAARLRIERGEQPGPRLFNSGPYFGTARPGWRQDITAEEIHREVDHWVEQGARGFKAKGIRPEHLRPLIERAHWHGMTVTGHLESGFRNTVNPRDAILMGIDRIEHFLGGDAITADRPAYSSLVEHRAGTPEFQRIAELYIRHNVFYDATLSAYGYYGRQDPAVFERWTDERRFFTPHMQQILAEREPRAVMEQFETIYWVKRATIKAFYDAGAGHLITIGTDHPSWGDFVSGFSFHRELHAIALSGIPNAAVLKIGTINGARALGMGDRLGTVEAGKWADLVIVRGNPLDDIRNTRNVDAVFRGGRMYDPRELLASVEGTIGPRNASEHDAWAPSGMR